MATSPRNNRKAQLGTVAAIYGTVTASVFGLSVLARIRKPAAAPVLVAACILMAGWSWTVTTQQLISFYEPTLSYAILDVISLSIVLYLCLRHGPAIWSSTLWLTFICQMFIHLGFVPWLDEGANARNYMIALNGFFIAQLAIVFLKTLLTLFQRPPIPAIPEIETEPCSMWEDDPVPIYHPKVLSPPANISRRSGYSSSTGYARRENHHAVAPQRSPGIRRSRVREK